MEEREKGNQEEESREKSKEREEFQIDIYRHYILSDLLLYKETAHRQKQTEQQHFILQRPWWESIACKSVLTRKCKNVQ